MTIQNKIINEEFINIQLLSDKHFLDKENILNKYTRTIETDTTYIPSPISKPNTSIYYLLDSIYNIYKEDILDIITNNPNNNLSPELLNILQYKVRTYISDLYRSNRIFNLDILNSFNTLLLKISKELSSKNINEKNINTFLKELHLIDLIDKEEYELFYKEHDKLAIPSLLTTDPVIATVLLSIHIDNNSNNISPSDRVNLIFHKDFISEIFNNYRSYSNMIYKDVLEYIFNKIVNTLDISNTEDINLINTYIRISKEILDLVTLKDLYLKYIDILEDDLIEEYIRTENLIKDAIEIINDNQKRIDRSLKEEYVFENDDITSDQLPIDRSTNNSISTLIDKSNLDEYNKDFLINSLNTEEDIKSIIQYVITSTISQIVLRNSSIPETKEELNKNIYNELIHQFIDNNKEYKKLPIQSRISILCNIVTILNTFSNNNELNELVLQIESLNGINNKDLKSIYNLLSKYSNTINIDEPLSLILNNLLSLSSTDSLEFSNSNKEISILPISSISFTNKVNLFFKWMWNSSLVINTQLISNRFNISNILHMTVEHQRAYIEACKALGRDKEAELIKDLLFNKSLEIYKENRIKYFYEEYNLSNLIYINNPNSTQIAATESTFKEIYRFFDNHGIEDKVLKAYIKKIEDNNKLSFNTKHTLSFLINSYLIRLSDPSRELRGKDTDSILRDIRKGSSELINNFLNYNLRNKETDTLYKLRSIVKAVVILDSVNLILGKHTLIEDISIHTLLKSMDSNKYIEEEIKQLSTDLIKSISNKEEGSSRSTYIPEDIEEALNEYTLYSKDISNDSREIKKHKVENIIGKLLHYWNTNRHPLYKGTYTDLKEIIYLLYKKEDISTIYKGNTNNTSEEDLNKNIYYIETIVDKENERRRLTLRSYLGKGNLRKHFDKQTYRLQLIDLFYDFITTPNILDSSIKRTILINGVDKILELNNRKFAELLTIGVGKVEFFNHTSNSIHTLKQLIPYLTYNLDNNKVILIQEKIEGIDYKEINDNNEIITASNEGICNQFISIENELKEYVYALDDKKSKGKSVVLDETCKNKLQSIKDKSDRIISKQNNDFDFILNSNMERTLYNISTSIPQFLPSSTQEPEIPQSLFLSRRIATHTIPTNTIGNTSITQPKKSSKWKLISLNKR